MVCGTSSLEEKATICSRSKRCMSDIFYTVYRQLLMSMIVRDSLSTVHNVVKHVCSSVAI